MSEIDYYKESSKWLQAFIPLRKGELVQLIESKLNLSNIHYIDFDKPDKCVIAFRNTTTKRELTWKEFYDTLNIPQYEAPVISDACNGAVVDGKKLTCEDCESVSCPHKCHAEKIKLSQELSRIEFDKLDRVKPLSPLVITRMKDAARFSRLLAQETFKWHNKETNKAQEDMIGNEMLIFSIMAGRVCRGQEPVAHNEELDNE